MKKVLIIFICLSMVLTMISCNRSPDDGSDGSLSLDISNDQASEGSSVSSGDDNPAANPASDFQYVFSENGESVYISKYIGTSETVVIPSEIEGRPVLVIKGVSQNMEIVSGAFENTGVRSVVIPESVTVIGISAFKDCKELEEVTVSSQCERLSVEAFQNCSKLEYIDLSRTKITRLEADAFSGCTALKEIRLPDTLQEIEQKAFYNCTSLEALELPSGLLKIGEEALFSCTSLKTINIPTDLYLRCQTSPVAYEVSSLEKIVFDDGREEIDGYAFFAIKSNAEIYIPASVKKFETWTFFIYSDVKIIFSGDCPEVLGESKFLGNATIYYDPDTEGWDECEWKNTFPMIPIE